MVDVDADAETLTETLTEALTETGEDARGEWVNRQQHKAPRQSYCEWLTY